MKLLLAFLVGILAIVIFLGVMYLVELLWEHIACFVRKRQSLRKFAGNATVKKYEGHLLAYWEQGWEGRIDFTLSVPGLDDPLWLKSGQRLTIYAEDGTILWFGVLCFVKRKWWEQHHLPSGIWSYVKPAGVSYARWMEWFAHQPPLKAALEIPETP